MSVIKKKKLLAILCRSDVLDRMDIDMFTPDPSTFSTQQNAVWNALDPLISYIDNDNAALASVDTPMGSVLTAIAAI